MVKKYHIWVSVLALAFLSGCATNPEKVSKPSESHDSETAQPYPVNEVQSLEPEMGMPSQSLPPISHTPPVSNTVKIRPGFYDYEVATMSTEERRGLIDIINHLKQTQSLIDFTKSQQNLDQRIKFRYDWLSKDLNTIIRGISDHLVSPEAQTRHVDPLVGQYGR